MVIARPTVRLRRWLAAVALLVLLLLGSAVALVRIEFEGPDLAENIAGMLNRSMRGRVSIESIEWPMSAIPKVATGGWVPVTLRKVEVWDGKGPDAESVLQTDSITAELDLHSLMFGRHDFVLRHVKVHGGRVLLREISEPYPLHDYDTTVFSLIAAFYSERGAGFRAGIFAATSPLWDLRDYELEDLDFEVRTKPNKTGTEYLFRALVHDVSAKGFLYMDPSDPLVPKFYFSLAPKGGSGQVDLYYDKDKTGRWLPKGLYSFPLRALDVHRLAQLPSGWPSDPVANSLAFDLEAWSQDDAHVRIRGAMIDYWDSPYGGTWDVNMKVDNAGNLLRNSVDSDAGGEHASFEAQVTGPIIFYPSVAIKAQGVTYRFPQLDPPLVLEVDNLTGVYDLAVDEGSIDEFVARGSDGEVNVSMKWGGDGTNRSPLWLDANTRIVRPIDMSPFLPPTMLRLAGPRLSGQAHLLRRKGDTNIGVLIDGIALQLGKLHADGGQIYVDKTGAKMLVDGVKFTLPGFTGTVRCMVYTGYYPPKFDGNDCGAAVDIGDVQALMRVFQGPKTIKKPAIAPAKARPKAQPRTLRPRWRGRRPTRQAQPSPAPTRAKGTGAKGTVKISGSLDDPHIQSTLGLERVPVIGSLRGTVKYQDDTVIIQDAVSTGLGGRLRISGKVLLEPTTTLDVRVIGTGIDLARLPLDKGLITGKAWADVTLRGPPDPRRIRASGWMCANKVTLLGDALADVGLWLERTPARQSACPSVTPPDRSRPMDDCLKVGSAGGRCAIARARREAGGEVQAIVSADAQQRLGGQLQISRMPLAAILALAGTKLPAGALLDTSGLALGGTLDAPTLAGSVRLSRTWVERGYLGDGDVKLEPVGPGKVQLSGSFLDGRVQLRGTLTTRAPYQLELSMELSHVELDAFVDPVRFGLPPDTHGWVSGRARIATRLGGPPSPLTATLELNDLSVSTRIVGPDDQPVPIAVRAASPLALTYDGVTATLTQPAVLSTPLGDITVRGQISPATLDVSASGKLDLTRVQPLVAKLFDRITGRVQLDARISGLTAKPHAQVSIDVEQVGMRLARQDATLIVPGGRITFSDGKLSFTGVSVEVDDGLSREHPAIKVGGGVTLDGLTPTRWALIIDGSLAGEMLLALAPATFSQASGTANLWLQLKGDGPTPAVNGLLTFGKSRPETDPDRRSLSILPRDLRRDITIDDGTVSFSGESASSLAINLEGVTGTIDHEGRLTSIGGDLALSNGKLVSADVFASAKGLPFRIQRTLDLVIDVNNLRLRLAAGELSLFGGVELVSGRFTRNFELGEVLVPSESTGPSAPPFWEASPLLANTRLDLDIGARKLSVVNNLANVDMEGRVQITGTPHDPRFDGSVRVSRGTFRIPGVRARFTRTSGEVSFQPTLKFPSATPFLNIRSEADYRDPSGVDHLVTLTIQGNLSRPEWDLFTASGLNRAQTLVLIISGRAPDDVRKSLGDQGIVDPTRIDPSTSTSQGYTDELLKEVASNLLTQRVADTLRDLSGLDVARIELNFGSFGFHGEKRLLENVGLIGDLERTTRGSTLSGRFELRLPPQALAGVPLLDRSALWVAAIRQIMAMSGELRLLSKNFDDSAERDINDLEVKVVLRILLGR